LSLGLNAFAVPAAESLVNQLVNQFVERLTHIFGASAADFASFRLGLGLRLTPPHFDEAEKSIYMYLISV
jgi:hypothetical protein